MERSRSDDTAPPALRRFTELFNGGKYWDSHEALEEAWRENGSEFYHGLILYASAMVHVTRQNPHGVRAQLTKAERVLSPYRPRHLGVDVDAIFDDAAARMERWDRPIPPLTLRA